MAAEMVGAAQAALDVITQFVAQRKTFGQPLGTFQAIRHRCADRLVDIAAADALVTDAGQLLQQSPFPASGEADAAVALAKIAAETALHAVAEEAILLRVRPRRAACRQLLEVVADEGGVVGAEQPLVVQVRFPPDRGAVSAASL